VRLALYRNFFNVSSRIELQSKGKPARTRQKQS
jgi:hypothetical protein